MSENRHHPDDQINAAIERILGGDTVKRAAEEECMDYSTLYYHWANSEEFQRRYPTRYPRWQIEAGIQMILNGAKIKDAAEVADMSVPALYFHWRDSEKFQERSPTRYTEEQIEAAIEFVIGGATLKEAARATGMSLRGLKSRWIRSPKYMNLHGRRRGDWREKHADTLSKMEPMPREQEESGMTNQDEEERREKEERRERVRERILHFYGLGRTITEMARDVSVFTEEEIADICLGPEWREGRPPPKRGRGGARPVLVDGVEIDSVRAAAKVIKCRQASLQGCLNAGHTTFRGHEIAYADPEEERMRQESRGKLSVKSLSREEPKPTIEERAAKHDHLDFEERRKRVALPLDGEVDPRTFLKSVLVSGHGRLGG